MSAARCVACVGRSVRELAWLGAETGSVRLSLHSLLSDAYTIDKQQHAQVQFLSSIDAVKRRVTRVSSQLSEMDSWRRKQDHLQAVLDSRDLYRIAAELQSLQSSMESLSALPAHYTVNQQHQVRQLQDRLEELCEPALLAGLRTKDVSGVARLCSIYRQMGKEPLMQRLYTTFRKEQVDGIARTYVISPSTAAVPAPSSADSATAATGSASDDTSYQQQRLRALPMWLPSYYSDVSQLLLEEAGWSAAVFATDTVPSSFVSIAAAVADRSSAHLTHWLTAWQSEHEQPPSDRLSVMQPIFACSVEFVRGVMRILRAQHGQSSLQSRQQLDGIVRVLLDPYKPLQSSLPDAQKQSMLASLDTLDMGAEEYDGAVSAVQSCLPVVLSFAADSVQQCLSLTGGLSAVGSLAALRSCIDELLTRLLSVALRLRRLRDKDERRARREADRHNADDPLAGGGDGWGRLSGLFALIAAVRGIEADGLRPAETHIREQLLTHIVYTLAVAQREDAARRDAPQGPHSSEGTHSETKEEGVDDEAENENDDEERVAMFACLLRADEQTRRALEDVVEKHHLHGLAAIQSSITRNDALRQLAAAPKYQPLDPSHSLSSPFSPATAAPAGLPASAVSPLLFLHSSLVLLLRLLSSLHGDVYDLLFAPLAARLRSFGSWKQWRSSSAASGSTGSASSSASSVGSLGVVATELRDDGSESEVALPSFSLQPSEYAVELGEYLLTVVQQIEPFVAQQRDDELLAAEATAASTATGTAGSTTERYVELDASYWLQRLASGTCSLLCSSICSLPQTALQSTGTCRQLAADLDYIANVLQAININMEPQLVAVMDAVAYSGDELIKQRYNELSSTNENYTQAARAVLESRMGVSHGPSASPAATAATSKVS